MVHKAVKLPRGDYVNGIAFSGDITFYISKDGRANICSVNGYANSAVVTQPQITANCDEICPLPNGGRIERRENILKIRY